MPAAALPSIERFLAEAMNAPLAVDPALVSHGPPAYMMGGERTPPGYRIEANIAPAYETKLPDKYETMARLTEATVPYFPGRALETYDSAAGTDAILVSAFSAQDKKAALSRVAEENRLVPLSEYLAGTRNKYDVLQEAEEIAARSESDPLGIGPARKYDLSRDAVTLVDIPEINERYERILKDPTPLQEGGTYFGTGSSVDDTKITFYVDRRLRGTHALAYVVDIPDIKESHPEEGRMLERAYGSRPLMALNPDVIRAMNPGMAVAYTPGTAQLKAVLGHEKMHLKQKGKTVAKEVGYPVLVHLGRHIATGEDVYLLNVIPAGEAFVEGGVEVAMKARGLTPPTDYFPENSLYNQYRRLVERVEKETPGFTPQFLRIARKKGPRAAAAFMDRLAGDTIVSYLRELNPGATIIKLPKEEDLYVEIPAVA